MKTLKAITIAVVLALVIAACGGSSKEAFVPNQLPVSSLTPCGYDPLGLCVEPSFDEIQFNGGSWCLATAKGTKNLPQHIQQEIQDAGEAFGSVAVGCFITEDQCWEYAALFALRVIQDIDMTEQEFLQLPQVLAYVFDCLDI